MSLNVNTGEEISLVEAQRLISNFQREFPDEVIAFFGGKNKIASILEQEDCIGIRIYNGYDEIENKMKVVLVGVDSNEEDIVQGIILDRLKPCPEHCSTRSPLMI